MRFKLICAQCLVQPYCGTMDKLRRYLFFCIRADRLTVFTEQPEFQRHTLLSDPREDLFCPLIYTVTQSFQTVPWGLTTSSFLRKNAGSAQYPSPTMTVRPVPYAEKLLPRAAELRLFPELSCLQWTRRQVVRYIYSAITVTALTGLRSSATKTLPHAKKRGSI